VCAKGGAFIDVERRKASGLLVMGDDDVGEEVVGKEDTRKKDVEKEDTNQEIKIDLLLGDGTKTTQKN